MTEVRIAMVLLVCAFWALPVGAQAQQYDSTGDKVVAVTAVGVPGLIGIVAGIVTLATDGACQHEAPGGYCTSRRELTDAGQAAGWLMIGGGALFTAAAVWLLTLPVVDVVADVLGARFLPDVQILEGGAALTIRGRL